MTKRNAFNIKNDLELLILKASESEAFLAKLLAKRLEKFQRWIKNTKNGLLNSKPQVLDLLVEIILDSEAWLDLSDFNADEKKIFYQQNNVSIIDQFWFDYLFPCWIQERDPKLTIWQEKIMAGKFTRNDETFINLVEKAINNQGGKSLFGTYYIRAKQYNS